MKKVTIFLVSIYLILSLIITDCLLSYNKINVVEIFGKVIVTSSEIKESGNDLIIINKKSNYEVGDEIYYYDSYSSSLKVSRSKISLIEKSR